MYKTTLKRNPEKIHAALKELEDGSLVALQPLKIYIPVRFAEQGLANVGSEVYIPAIFAIVLDDQYYGVSKDCAVMRITPTDTNTVKFGEDDYYEFVFERGSVMIPNLGLVKTDTYVYYVYNEIIAKGRVPWYLDYDDLGGLFDSTEYHAGMVVGENHAIYEMIAASITRLTNDRTKLYRQNWKDSDDYTYIPLRNITYGATNTTARIDGAYFDEGITSALVNPSESVEPFEEILRN